MMKWWHLCYQRSARSSHFFSLGVNGLEINEYLAKISAPNLIHIAAMEEIHHTSKN
jgi:hypothetical protein